MTMRMRGLIERRLVKEHTVSCVEIQETWDVTVPGCPILVIDLASGHVSKDATTVTRNILIGKYEWMHADGEPGDKP